MVQPARRDRLQRAGGELFRAGRAEAEDGGCGVQPGERGTTRTAGDGPYRRRDAVFPAAARRLFPRCWRRSPQLRYEPGHPDESAQGYIAYPNADPVVEMVNLSGASRSQGANVTVMEATKNPMLRAPEIRRSALGILLPALWGGSRLPIVRRSKPMVEELTGLVPGVKPAGGVRAPGPADEKGSRRVPLRESPKGGRAPERRRRRGLDRSRRGGGDTGGSGGDREGRRVSPSDDGSSTEDPRCLPGSHAVAGVRN